MTDSIRISSRGCCSAAGKYCIELKDPNTGRATKTVQGKNHVFSDSLRSDNLQILDSIPLVLTDGTQNVMTDFPFLSGYPIGNGIPGYNGYENIRGAYESSAQILRNYRPATNSLYWKYRYNFTTTQANGSISSIGLTFQYMSSCARLGIIVSGTQWGGSNVLLNFTNDGKYGYLVTRSGTNITISYVEPITNVWNNISISNFTYDSNYSYAVVFFSDTGKYGIMKWSTSSSYKSNNKLYVYADNSFSALTATYTISNIPSAAIPNHCMYGYGNHIYIPSSSAKLYRYNYATDTQLDTVTFQLSAYDPVSIRPSASSDAELYKGTFAIGSRLYMFPHQNGFVYDMGSENLIAITCENPVMEDYYNIWIRNVFNVNRPPLLVGRSGTNITEYDQAITAKKLDSPITKTSANGMTVTYELEVFL